MRWAVAGLCNTIWKTSELKKSANASFFLSTFPFGVGEEKDEGGALYSRDNSLPVVNEPLRCAGWTRWSFNLLSPSIPLVAVESLVINDMMKDNSY